MVVKTLRPCSEPRTTWQPLCNGVVAEQLNDAMVLVVQDPNTLSLSQDDLAAALDGLPAEQFEWAMALVLARHPGLAPPPGGAGELAFELGALGTVTLRQLQHFAAACRRPGGPPPRLAGAAGRRRCAPAPAGT